MLIEKTNGYSICPLKGRSVKEMVSCPHTHILLLYFFSVDRKCSHANLLLNRWLNLKVWGYLCMNIHLKSGWQYSLIIYQIARQHNTVTHHCLNFSWLKGLSSGIIYLYRNIKWNSSLQSIKTHRSGVFESSTVGSTTLSIIRNEWDIHPFNAFIF